MMQECHTGSNWRRLYFTFLTSFCSFDSFQGHLKCLLSTLETLKDSFLFSFIHSSHTRYPGSVDRLHFPTLEVVRCGHVAGCHQRQENGGDVSHVCTQTLRQWVCCLLPDPFLPLHGPVGAQPCSHRWWWSPRRQQHEGRTQTALL